MTADVRPALDVNNLSKRFGGVTAVDDVSFVAPKGAVTGFVGGNGAGKTTTMRMILGLVTPLGGSALIDGRPISEHSDPRRSVGALVDRLGAHPGLTGRKHLTLLSESAGLSPDRADEVLDLVGLADAADRRVGEYSTGMGRRLGLAAALLGDSPLLLLDEPSSGLDPAGIRWLRTLLRERADSGAAVFVSTHQLAELGTVVDHLVVLDRGRVIATGPAKELMVDAGVHSIEDLLLSKVER